ncbi:IS21 family transposase [Sandaracinobacter sp. RS1-74]|uniref:IS21 family transposase n=1 Tax=Sandaracinobacteroides TaxID=2883109 RepID=UPI0018F39742|nr:IS21 family transposase [Sandaracinobacteroides hominis]MCG2839946.1 IS21 family transposase [Sandaracinobacteroides sayramensis]
MQSNLRAVLRQILTTNHSPNFIAEQRGMSHNTVRNWRRILEEKEITSTQLDLMTDQQLDSFIRRRRPALRGTALPDWDDEVRAIRSGLNRLETHAIYVGRVGEDCAMAYRTYCEHLRLHLQALDPILRLDHVPGYANQTDYAGYMPEGRENGGHERRKFKLFVAALPFSRLIAAAIVRSETVGDHIEGNQRALHYYGGVPAILVPDNLKAAVISRPKYGPPRLQEQYQAFADHYGAAVVPARPGRPQDKSAVENSVKLVQRLLGIRLSQRPLLEIDEMQRVLDDIVEQLNNRPMRRANGHSRRSLFEAEERMHLKPLPAQRFELREPTVSRKIAKDYHVEYKSNYYSVPHRLVGQNADVRATGSLVELFVDGLSVAVHTRAYSLNCRITNDQHRPPSHSFASQTDLMEWAKRYTADVEKLAEVEVMRTELPEIQRRQRIAWIQNLPRIHGRQRFEQACRRANSFQDLRFDHVRNALDKGIESSMPEPLAQAAPPKPQRNVRGARYFGKKG